MPSHLGDKIAELEALDRPDLCARWKETFKRPAPKKISRDLLLRALAYHVQEQAEGGLTLRFRSQLAKLADAFERDSGFTPAPTPVFKPGNERKQSSLKD